MRTERLTEEQLAQARRNLEADKNGKPPRQKPGQAIELSEPEPWPWPVADGAVLADEMYAAVRRHVRWRRKLPMR